MIDLKVENVAVDVLRKRIKTIRLSVHPPQGQVRLSAPWRMSMKAIRLFVLAQLPWIHKQQSKLRSQPHQVLVKADPQADERNRAFLVQAIPPLLAEWVPRIDVPMPTWTIRKMKTRWGSCTPARRSIRLNSDLANKPHECLVYVLVHELVHFLEPSHNKRFAALMTQFMPDWRVHRHALKENFLKDT